MDISGALRGLATAREKVSDVCTEFQSPSKLTHLQFSHFGWTQLEIYFFQLLTVGYSVLTVSGPDK